MSDQFDTLIGPLLAVEGGYTNDPTDPGGATNFGITEATARANGYLAPMQDMEQADAEAIYREVYWTKPGLDHISTLSQPIAAEMFDTGVNMGVSTAGKFLQRSLNVLNNGAADYPDLTADGAVGNATVSALKAFLTKRGSQGETVMLRCLNGLQCAHYIEIAEGKPSQEKYEYGWIANRVS
jgi:lysozyme family protein